MSTPFVYWGSSISTWQSSYTFPSVKQRRITTFKSWLSHCICHRFAGKAFAARPMVHTEQVSWWNGCSTFCLLSEEIPQQRKKKGLTSEIDSLTGKLEGQSYNYSSAMTPGVEFIFLNIGISNHFRHLTVADTPSWAWQIDTSLIRPLPF